MPGLRVNGRPMDRRDRKSTLLNSSHSSISYAAFCLKKKNRRCLVHSKALTILAAAWAGPPAACWGPLGARTVGRSLACGALGYVSWAFLRLWGLVAAARGASGGHMGAVSG